MPLQMGPITLYRVDVPDIVPHVCDKEWELFFLEAPIKSWRVCHISWEERRVAIFSVSVFSEQHYHTVDQLDFHVHLYDFSTKRNDGIEKPRVQMIVLCWKKDPSYLAFDFDELWTVSWCWCISNQSKIVQEFLIL